MTQIAKNPEHWALVIAIEKYTFFDRLNSPGADAARFSQWLIERGGVPKEHVVPVVGANEEGRPTAGHIIDSFTQLGALMNVRKGSRLYIYYAGHGLAPTFDDVAIVPANVQLGMLNGECLSIRSFMQFLINTGLFDEVVVFMDCCRDYSMAGPKTLPFEATEKFEGSVEPVNYFALFGAAHGGKSWAVQELMDKDGNLLARNESDFRGIMTAAVIEALEGAPAAFDHSGRITSASLSAFVKTRVEEKARLRRLEQMVQPLLSGHQEIVFLNVSRPPTITMSVRVGRQSAGKRVTVQNMRTFTPETKIAGEAGTVLDFVIEGNTRHQIVVGDFEVRRVFAPAELGRGGNAEIP